MRSIPAIPDVLESVARVIPLMRHVRIAEDRIGPYARKLIALRATIDAGADDLLFRGSRQDCANFVLRTDALNFCFWSDEPWEVEYRGKRWTRTFAMVAGVLRAIEADRAWLDPKRWVAATEADVERIFAGRGTIPLLAQRLTAFWETGAVLLEHYAGRFDALVDAVGGDARRVAYRLGEEFASFRDIAEYDGAPVAFLKRAQICAADLHRTWLANGHGGLANMDALTVFADYRLPQLMRDEGLIVLDKEFAARIDRGEEIPAQSPEEIELRAATIWVGKLLANALAATGQATPMWELDYVLWVLARRPEVRVPHHRTITQFY